MCCPGCCGARWSLPCGQLAGCEVFRWGGKGQQHPQRQILLPKGSEGNLAVCFYQIKRATDVAFLEHPSRPEAFCC